MKTHMFVYLITVLYGTSSMSFCNIFGMFVFLDLILEDFWRIYEVIVAGIVDGSSYVCSYRFGVFCII